MGGGGVRFFVLGLLVLFFNGLGFEAFLRFKVLFCWFRDFGVFVFRTLGFGFSGLGLQDFGF